MCSWEPRTDIRYRGLTCSETASDHIRRSTIKGAYRRLRFSRRVPQPRKSAQLHRVTQRLCMLALIVLLVPEISPAYSVLTHEAIIDSAWEAGIKPLLQARYPNLTEDQLREAKSYAYGGSVIQDLGYYPFGS